MYKRITHLLLVLSMLAISITACGGNEPAVTSTSVLPTTQATITEPTTEIATSESTADDGTDLVVSATETIVFVSQDNATGIEDGSSWQTAFLTVQEGLDAAEAAGGGEVWVAAGTYLPTEIPTETLQAFDLTENEDNTCSSSTNSFTEDQYKTIFLREGVHVYGGFAGTETSLDQRDWEKNETILSGDLNGDDCSSSGNCGVDAIYPSCSATETGYVEAGTNYEDNTYHVVMAAKVSNTTLDGFVIRGGNANGYPGTGTACGVFGQSSDDEIYRILQNYLTGSGGGVIVLQADPLIRNTTIEYNRAGKGGGVYHLTATSPQPEESALIPKYDNVIIKDNFASIRGGGMSNDWRSSPIIYNSQILNNVCESKGGGVYSDMGCNPKLVNTLIAGNRAERGSGSVSDGSSNAFYAYTTVTQNEACDIGAALYQGTHRPDGNGNSPYAFASIVLNNNSKTNGLAVTNWLWSSLTSMEGSVIQENETETNDDWNSCLTDTNEPASACQNVGWSPTRDVDFDDSTISGWISQMVEHGSGDYYDVSSSTNDATLYVNASASCGTSCDGSQDNPYASLRTALEQAGNGSTVYVAPGFYAALGDGSGLSRTTATYVVPDGASLIGCTDSFTTCADKSGFLTVDERTDLSNAGLPVLSGASAESDTTTTDNAYHVAVLGTGSTLKGFVVQGGYADGGGYHKQGGGLLTYETSITVEYVLVTDNYAVEGGGITLDYMPANDTSSTVSNSVFYKNTAQHTGGAVLGRIGQLSFSITFSNVIFEENSSILDRGGAVYMDYGFDADFRNCAFINNSSAASSGGAVYLDDNASQFPGTALNFYSSTFNGNTAAVHGGAIEVYNTVTAVYVDGASTFSNNKAAGKTNDVYVGFSGKLCYDANSTNLEIEQVSSADVSNNITDAGDCSLSSGSSPQSSGNGPALAVAAEILGITEQELMDALGPPPPDIEAAAETLGITVEELQNALDEASDDGGAGD